MYVVQQGGAGEPAFVLPQQALVGSRVAVAHSSHPYTPAVVFQQQGRAPITAQQQQQQRVLLAGAQQQQQQLQQAANGFVSSGGDGSNQVVYVNVNGSLQQGIIRNGAVYLLANAATTAGMPQAAASGMQQFSSTGGQAMTLQQQQQQQQQVMLQQVIYNNNRAALASTAMSAALVASRAGVQLQPAQHLQPQLQARPVLTVGNSMAPPQQQQAPVYMHAAALGPNNVAVHAAAGPRAVAVPTGVTLQAPPAQQQVLVQVPSAQAAAHQAALAHAAAGRPMIVSSGMTTSTVSASTASLMPRMATTVSGTTAAASKPAAHFAAAGSAGDSRQQPMTVAAALAALPSNAAPAAAASAAVTTPASSNGLPSPVAPPGTPGVGRTGGAAPSGAAAAGTIGAVISKLAGPGGFAGAAAAPAEVGGPAAGAVVVSGPQPAGEPGVALGGGMFPLTSQPGTPSRSNSMGANSSSSCSSSSSGGGSRLSGSEVDATDSSKMAMMRMFARTFIETGIALEQAINMVQAGDKDLLIKAFAAEAVAASPTAGGDEQATADTGRRGSIEAAAAAGAAAPAGGAAFDGLSVLGGEQISMPPTERRFSGPSGLQQLANRAAAGLPVASAAAEGVRDTAPGLDNALGGWGSFSLFGNNTASDIGGGLGGGGFGSIAAKLLGGCTAAPSTSDAASAVNLFANLHL